MACVKTSTRKMLRYRFTLRELMRVKAAILGVNMAQCGKFDVRTSNHRALMRAFLVPWTWKFCSTALTKVPNMLSPATHAIHALAWNIVPRYSTFHLYATCLAHVVILCFRNVKLTCFFVGRAKSGKCVIKRKSRQRCINKKKDAP